jgi:hypothetical protein
LVSSHLSAQSVNEKPKRKRKIKNDMRLEVVVCFSIVFWFAGQ